MANNRFRRAQHVSEALSIDTSHLGHVVRDEIAIGTLGDDAVFDHFVIECAPDGSAEVITSCGALGQICERGQCVEANTIVATRVVNEHVYLPLGNREFRMRIVVTRNTKLALNRILNGPTLEMINFEDLLNFE